MPVDGRPYPEATPTVIAGEEPRQTASQFVLSSVIRQQAICAELIPGTSALRAYQQRPIYVSFEQRRLTNHYRSSLSSTVCSQRTGQRDRDDPEPRVVEVGPKHDRDSDERRNPDAQAPRARDKICPSVAALCDSFTDREEHFIDGKQAGQTPAGQNGQNNKQCHVVDGSNSDPRAEDALRAELRLSDDPLRDQAPNSVDQSVEAVR